MNKQIGTPVLVDTARSRPASAQTEKYTRCHASPGTYGKRERESRASLQALLIALDASPLSLQRDFWSGMGRRGDHAIYGKRGHIYPDGDGYLLCVGGWRYGALPWDLPTRRTPDGTALPSS